MIERIFIMGAGAAGGSLAVALAKAGLEIAGVYDPVRDRASAIAKAAKTRAYWKEPPEASRESDLVFLAVADPQVLETAEEITRNGLNAPSQIWLHLSGSLAPSALAPLKKNGSFVGAFHPAHAFSPGRITEIPSGVFFAVDGDEPALKAAGEIAEKLKGFTVGVSAQLRPLYHAATVFASNYIVALLWQARTLLSGSGFESAKMERLLTSLASSSLKQAEENGIEASLSGPIRRGDVQAVVCHLEAIAKNPEIQELYRTMGKAALRMTETIGESDINSLNSIGNLLKN